ncbi:MAG: hypothetical protein IPL88_16635 [Rhizobiales bacterium]|nr:hypothetical protein [Hyphomicrobiales bacterium]
MARRKRMIGPAALLVAAIGLLGDWAMAASSKRLGAEQTGAVVTMNIYSGRPDPTWTLEGGRLAELLRRLDALPEAAAAPPPAGALGYRGLTVSFSDGREIEIGGGRVAIGAASLEDRGRDLERWIVGTGRESVDARALDAALGQIDKSK